MLWEDDLVVCGELKDDWVVGYKVPKENRPEVERWLKSLPIVKKTWLEPLVTYRNRRHIGLDMFV